MKTKRFGVMILMCVMWFTAHEAQAFYNPSSGRWLNRDPIGERGGVNFYSLVGNDPIRNTDSFGLAVPSGPS
ncbi:MAG: RHS repeat-associated core domain-containing protein [Verrucomicrobiota bacterium]